ncbi:hypothetical protein [Spirosoma montaniterrae]|uniref:WYL domain-containing protein n=1 Tax=Spirosoma montaniterrae TaxID=1178516 RepID=A0A1P9WYS4_9BACT|nr:hypothetical protein [Spirosoma montaniterrae]AQG80468.1 hypothetical protein AWR27_14735 [Spirosoma montaniterrae]
MRRFLVTLEEVGFPVEKEGSRHLLLEERPTTRPNIYPVPDDATFSYRYTGEVRSWIGVGRFILGLPGQIRIDSPDKLRAYVRGG